MEDKPKKPSRWRGRLGWVLFTAGAAERVIGWGGSLDFLISRSQDPGWIASVLTLIASNASYLGFFLMLAGVALIVWSERRRADRLLEARFGALQPAPEPEIPDAPPPAPTAPPPPPSGSQAKSITASSNAAKKGPHYEYPKAVIQVQRPIIEKSGNSDGTIGNMSGMIIVKSECYTDLIECQVIVRSIKSNGISQTIMKPLRKRQFTLGKGATQRIPIIHRDFSDRVSKPPFLLTTVPDRLALDENTTYDLVIELRSEYQYPTVADIQIVTGQGEDLAITLQDQRVEHQSPQGTAT